MDDIPLSESTESSLRNFSDISLETFKNLSSLTIQSLLEKKKRIALDDTFSGADHAVKKCHEAISTVVLECIKHDFNGDQLCDFLEGHNVDSERAKVLGSLFEEHRIHLQILLSSIGTYLPHIVDIDWKLDYVLKNNYMDKVNEPRFLISLKTEDPSTEAQQNVQFSCTENQLQDLVAKLKDAHKAVEMTAAAAAGGRMTSR